MIIWNIALKNFKTVAKNYLMLAFLILMPILQLYMIKAIVNNTAVSGASGSGFVELVFTAQIINSNMLQTFTAAIMVQFLLLTGMIAGSLIIAEREQNTMLRMSIAPISKTKLLFGILLGHSAVIFLVSAVIILVSYYWFEVAWGKSWINLSILTLIAVYVAAAMAFIISGLFRSSKTAGGVMSIVVIFMTFMSGGIIQSDSLDLVSNLTINKWITDAYLSLMQGHGLSSIKLNLLVLLIIGTVFMLSAGYIYRRENIYE